MNIECSQEVLEEITTLFRYNDAVLRNLVIKRKDAITDMSEIMKAENESRERKARASARMQEESSYDDAGSDDDDDDDDADNDDSDTDDAETAVTSDDVN
jgi:small subunit ribosomal protein S6